jgi:putative transposase
MSKPYSDDLRRRVVSSVIEGGVSRRQAAERYNLGISTVIRWVARFEATGSVSPGKIGGYKPRAISGGHRDWLVERCRGSAFTLRGLVSELAGRGLKVDYRSVWAFVHEEKLSYKKRRWSRPNADGRMSRAAAISG